MIGTFMGSDGHTFLGFAAAWKVRRKTDFSSIARKLPEAVVICSPRLVAGREHLDGVLFQATESWSRGIMLARNKSIDLLMRVTGKRQIDQAIEASGISAGNEIAAFGIANEVEAVGDVTGAIENLCHDYCERMDALFDVSAEKLRFLKKFHSIPKAFSDSQVCALLLERAALLSVSK